MTTNNVAGHTAFDLQKQDDDRAENVAAIFIEDAMKEHGLRGFRAFAAVEKVADRLWIAHLRKTRR